LRGISVHTPLLETRLADADPLDGRRLFLKLENLQPIGAFKLRGAYNKIASLSDEERRRGVISYSSGNHAQGVAYAARALHTKAVIVMPGSAPAIKLALCNKFRRVKFTFPFSAGPRAFRLCRMPGPPLHSLLGDVLTCISRRPWS